MSELLQKNKLIKINTYLVFAVAFTLPFSLDISLKIFGLWIFTSLFLFDYNRLKKSKHKIYLALNLLLFALYIAGIFYSDNIDGVLYQLGIKFYIFLLPFIFLWANPIYKRFFDKILAYHILGSATAYIICFAFALYSSLHFADGHIIFTPEFKQGESFWSSIVFHGNRFFYQPFSIFLHPSYAAINSNFAFAALVFLRRNPYKLQMSKLSKTIVRPGYFYTLLFILFLSIIEYSSRTNMLAFAFLLFFIVLTSKLRFKYFLSFLVIIISAAILLLNPRFVFFVKQTYQEGKMHEKPVAFNRYYLWKAGYEVATEHFFFGVGTGDLQNELNKIYEREGLKRPLSHNMNSHNEFLQHWARLGIFGLWILVLIFGYALIVALYCRRRLLFYFLVLVFINFTFEAMLDRVAGVMFYSFFLNLLLLMDFNREELPKISF